MSPEDLATLASLVLEGLQDQLTGPVQLGLERLLKDQEQRLLAVLAPEPGCRSTGSSSATRSTCPPQSQDRRLSFDRFVSDPTQRSSPVESTSVPRRIEPMKYSSTPSHGNQGRRKAQKSGLGLDSARLAPSSMKSLSDARDSELLAPVQKSTGSRFLPPVKEIADHEMDVPAGRVSTTRYFTSQEPLSPSQKGTEQDPRQGHAGTRDSTEGPGWDAGFGQKRASSYQSLMDVLKCADGAARDGPAHGRLDAPSGVLKTAAEPAPVPLQRLPPQMPVPDSGVAELPGAVTQVQQPCDQPSSPHMHVPKEADSVGPGHSLDARPSAADESCGIAGLLDVSLTDSFALRLSMTAAAAADAAATAAAVLHKEAEGDATNAWIASTGTASCSQQLAPPVTAMVTEDCSSQNLPTPASSHQPMHVQDEEPGVAASATANLPSLAQQQSQLRVVGGPLRSFFRRTSNSHTQSPIEASDLESKDSFSAQSSSFVSVERSTRHPSRAMSYSSDTQVVRVKREQELLGSIVPATSPSLSTLSVQSRSSSAPCMCLWRPVPRVDSPLLLRLCSILPWDRFGVAYRGGMLLLTGCLVAVCTLQLCWAQGHGASAAHCDSVGVCLHLGYLSDVVLAAGTLMGLLALRALATLELLGGPTAMLVNYAVEQGAMQKWSSAASLQLLYLAGLWLGSLALRAVTVWSGPSWQLSAQAGVFALTSAIFMGLVFGILHVSCLICIVIDSYALSIEEGKDPAQGIREWDKLGALLRKVSRAMDRGFLLVQTTAGIMLLCCFCLVMLQDPRQVWWLASNALLAYSQILLLSKAAEVTEMCARMPALINSLDFGGNDFSHERHYLVEHIAYSAAGFYVWEVRLTAAMAMKLTYASIVAAFGVLTKVHTV